MPTNTNPTKNEHDIEDERERRQEQASQQPRDEMGRFEEGSEVSVHDRKTSRMSAPDDEELHEQMNQGRRNKNPSASADDSGAEEAKDMPVGRDDDERDGERDSEREIDDSDVVSSISSEDSESEGDVQGRAQVSQVGRSKQSINASKRPRDAHGRFESANRGKKRDDPSRGKSGSDE